MEALKRAGFASDVSLPFSSHLRRSDVSCLMWRSLIACALAIVLTNLLYLPTAAAKPSGNKEERKLEKLKTGIRKLGIGSDACIKVRLKDKTEISGHISEAGEDSFVVIDATGKSNFVAYRQVAQAKGNNLSSKEKLAITLVTVGVIAVLLLIGAPKS